MVPQVENLEILAKNYVTFLSDRQLEAIKPYLSLNFLKRQKVMEQFKLISELPQLLYGFGLEIHLFEEYPLHKKNGQTIISPFQFQISYSLHMNLVELEKTTITIHSVVLEENVWKIESIITEEDKKILKNVINNMQVKKRS